MKTTTSYRLRRVPRRILVVNDVPLVHEGIANWIKGCPDLLLCAEVLGEQGALEQVTKLRPDLVITEIMRPQGLAFVRELRRRRRLPILVFSFRAEEAYAPLALEAGARGYLMKNVDGDTLVAGIRKALNGRVVLSRAMAARLRRCGNSQRGRLLGPWPRRVSEGLKAVRRRADCVE